MLSSCCFKIHFQHTQIKNKKYSYSLLHGKLEFLHLFIKIILFEVYIWFRTHSWGGRNVEETIQILFLPLIILEPSED